MEVVLVGVPAALVDQRDVRVTLNARERDAALVSNHLLGGVGVDPTCHVSERAGEQPSPARILSCCEAKPASNGP